MTSILIDITNTVFDSCFRDFGRGSHFAVLRSDQAAQPYIIDDVFIFAHSSREFSKSVKPAQKRQARSLVLIRSLTNKPKINY